MIDKKYLSTSQYAKKHHISKMQVIRLIKSGKILAERIGSRWLIEETISNLNQIGLEKTTSLQKWNKVINSIFHKHLHIEESKDRELIYSRLHSLGLPHEHCLAFTIGRFPSRTDFENSVGCLGYPYWISAVPDPRLTYLNRQSKLRLYDIASGWSFINELPEKKNYKIVISQYADNPEFKGSVLISHKGFGIAEFVTGDRHYIMTRGYTLTDPMLFDQNSIVRFSKTVAIHKQEMLYRYLKGVSGHLEFQYGKIKEKKNITFFDYNDEKAYIEIDLVWHDLIDYFNLKKKKKACLLYGYPASPGKAEGQAIVLHHEMIGMFEKVNKGDILVTDATTPEMTPIMKKVSGIITDFGGVTSHAAIVCRELRIPAIVGTGDATAHIRTGNYIKIDADKGEIEIV